MPEPSGLVVKNGTKDAIACWQSDAVILDGQPHVIALGSPVDAKHRLRSLSVASTALRMRLMNRLAELILVAVDRYPRVPVCIDRLALLESH